VALSRQSAASDAAAIRAGQVPTTVVGGRACNGAGRSPPGGPETHGRRRRSKHCAAADRRCTRSAGRAPKAQPAPAQMRPAGAVPSCCGPASGNVSTCSLGTTRNWRARPDGGWNSGRRRWDQAGGAALAFRIWRWRRQPQRRSVLSRGNSVRRERNHAVQNQPLDRSRFARKHRGAGFDGVTVTLITPRRNDRGGMASTTPRQRKTTGRVMHESRADPEREHVHPSPA
jgi:hypothetical protein